MNGDVTTGCIEQDGKENIHQVFSTTLVGANVMILYLK